MARAQTPPATQLAAPPPAAPTEPRWDHAGQFGLRAGVAGGYSFIVRYGDGNDPDPCDDANNKFCAGLAPFMLDTALGFGVTRGLELEGRFRLGIDTSFDGSRPLQGGFGLRFLTDPDSRFRFFLGVAFLADFTQGRRRAGGDFDALVRAEEGVHFDITRWFGAYAAAGETFGLVRNFSCVIDLGVGVQFRAPP